MAWKLVHNKEKGKQMTETVFWTNEEARTASGTVTLTVTSWDYEQKRGTAMLPGGHFVEVRMVEILTVVPEKEKKA